MPKPFLPPEQVLEATRLKELFSSRAQMTQRAFGEKFGLGTAPMVWQYLNAIRALNLTAGCRFARGLGVDLAEFSPRLAGELHDVLGSAEEVGTGLSTGSDYIRVPCVELMLRSGSRKYSTKPLLPLASFIAFRQDWLESRGYARNSLAAIQCPDDGMRPTVTKGDLVVVNTADRDPSDAAVYAINYEGQLQLRRLFRDAGRWWLNCDNPDSQRFPRRLFVEKHCFLIGRVIHRQSETL